MWFRRFSKLLVRNQEFVETILPFKMEYETDVALFDELKKHYGLDTFVQKSNEFDAIKKLLFWVNDNIYHNGGMMAKNIDNYDALSLLNRSFKKSRDNGLNCVCLSFVLTTLYLAYGIKAFPVWMMPKSSNDSDNHVVVNVFSKEHNKWIMVDPTYGSYFANDEGVPLNNLELRTFLSNGVKPNINEEFKYNDVPEQKITSYKNRYYSYMAKNSYWFIVHHPVKLSNMYQSDARYIYPKGFDPKQRTIQNLKYRIKKYGISDWIENRLKDLKHTSFEGLSFKDLYQSK